MTAHRFGDWLFTATCLSLLAFIAVHSVGSAPSVPPAREGTVQRDGGFPELASLAGRRRVVLILSPSCGYSTLSLPFYTKLVDRSDRSAYEIVVSSRVPREEIRAYLDQNGLASLVVVDEPPPAETTATPMILLLDRQGRLLRSWRGKLSPDQEEQLLTILSSILPERKDVDG